MGKQIPVFLCIMMAIMLFLSACSASKAMSNSVKRDVAVEQAKVADIKGTENQTNSDKKIIKNAKASITVKAAEKTIEALGQWINNNGGVEFSRNTNVSSQHSRVYVVYKVKPEQLQPFMDQLKSHGEITACEIKSEDITDQYFDASARLESLKKGREQFYEILKKANNIDEILKVQDQINRISGDIEGLQGKINLWNKMIAESTIELTITEESDPIKDTQISWNFTSPQDIGKVMKNGFILTTNMLLNLFAWILILIVSLTPLIILAGIILGIKWWRRKNKQGK